MRDNPTVFGPFSYDEATETLWRDGRQIPLGARATALLGALLGAGGGVVTREALLQAAWGDAAVEDGNLAVQIAGLRKILGPRDDGEEWIATVPRVGYRLQRDVPVTASGRPVLAVLPFVAMSDDPDQGHVADGIVDDLITAFSRFRNMGVIARQSAFVYKNREFDIRDAAQALKVRYLLEGSVRRSGDRMRVTVQLIDGASGEHIWAEKVDGSIQDLFEFQDHVTSTVVGLIEPEIRKAEIVRAQRKHPSSLDAYDHYWRALPLLQAPDGSRYSEAVDLLDRAVALEPTFGPILAMAAYAHGKRLDWGYQPQGVDDQSIATSLSKRAMAADSSDPWAILVAGGIENSKGNIKSAVALARKAYELNPNNVLICNITGWFTWAEGHYEESTVCCMRAMVLSPIAPEQFWSLAALARNHMSQGRFEEALLWALRSIERNPDFPEAREFAIAAYAQLGQIDEARSQMAELVKRKPGTTLQGLIEDIDQRVAVHQRHKREGYEKLAAADNVLHLRTFNTG